MKKVLIFLFVVLNIYASEFEINAIDKKSGAIECENLRVGESGLVIRELGDFRTIIANATITKVEESKCSVEFSEFVGLVQEALPRVKEKPAIGDKIIFKTINKRALAIAPNLKSYEEITNKSDISFIHPDIFATYLESESNPSPTKESFAKFCNAYSIGLIYFAIDREYIVDCFSFKVLETNELEIKKEDEIKPFYSRAGELKASIFSFKDEIKDYMSYYKKLLGL